MQENSFFNNLINKLTDLPGIGKKTAQRLAFYIMKMKRAEALSLAEAIINVKEKVTVYLADIISKSGMRVTRIARGLPVGSDLEFADKVTLTRSFEGRMNIK